MMGRRWEERRNAVEQTKCWLMPSWSYVITIQLYKMYDVFSRTVEPRNNRPAFKGSPSIKVNISRSKMVILSVISPLFKGEPKIKLKNLWSQWRGPTVLSISSSAYEYTSVSKNKMKIVVTPCQA